MVIHGQSAGGVSVDYYSYDWTEDPIISGFIPQSGTAAIRAPVGSSVNTTLAAINQWSTLSTTLGCGTVTAEDVSKSLSCMRSKSLTQVMDATAPPKGGNSNTLSWGPKIDDKTVFRDLTDRGNKGKFIHAVSSFVSEVKSVISNEFSQSLLETLIMRVQTRVLKSAAKLLCSLIAVLVVLLKFEKMLVFQLGDISMLGILRIRKRGHALKTLRVPGT